MISKNKGTYKSEKLETEELVRTFKKLRSQASKISNKKIEEEIQAYRCST